MGSRRSRAAPLLLWAAVMVCGIPSLPEKGFLAQTSGHVMHRGKLPALVLRAAQADGQDEGGKKEECVD
eukprot:3322895-Amphidinium_carterae.1